VQVPDLWKLPIGQVHLLNLLDLCELFRTEGAPKSLKTGLQSFWDRTSREIRDLPKGGSFDAFVAELVAVDPGRIPQVIRELLVEEAERRDHGATRELLATLEEHPPEPFAIGVRKAKVQRAEAASRKKRSVEPSSAPSEKRGGASKSRSSGSTRGASPNAGRVSTPILDIDRHKFLQQLALQRLAGTSDKGLMEAVLVAGIRHLAKDEYSDVTPKQVKDALKGLKDDGRVRYSAGRWMGLSRY
jgi:hypothetical protein